MSAPPPPLPPPPPELPPTVGPFLVAKLAGYSDKLKRVVPRLLRPDDDEAVHDLRVAIRRGRIVLAVGRSVLGPFHADEVRRTLRDVQRETGALRDEEVLLELVAPIARERSTLKPWVEARRRRERRLRAALRRGLEQGQVDKARRLLDALLLFPIKPSRERPLAKFARRAVEAARAGVEGRLGTPIDDAVALHELRIACKKLRYAIGTFDDALTPGWDALAQTAARFQSSLGDLHDVDMTLAAVQAARGVVPADRAALLAALTRVRAERSAAFEAERGAASFARPLSAT